MSPPELSDASTTYSGSRHSGGTYSARSSSYAPSHISRDYDDCNSTSGIDLVDMLSERMDRAFDPIKMDRSLARQAQT
jgi:biogenesis of lysosome-related organelles complex 1 subunit KXD1